MESDVQRGECPPRDAQQGFNQSLLVSDPMLRYCVISFEHCAAMDLKTGPKNLKTYPDEEIVLSRKTARRQGQVYVFPVCTGKGVRCSVRLLQCPVSAASMEKPLELQAFCFPEASLVQKQLLPDLKISSRVGTKPPECQSSSDLLQLW